MATAHDDAFAELVRRARNVVAMRDEGILTDAEFDVALAESVTEVAHRFQGSRADRADHARLSRALIASADDPRGFLLGLRWWAQDGAEEDADFESLCDTVLTEAFAGDEIDADVAELALAVARRRDLPPPLDALARELEPGHPFARAALELALRDGDLARAAALVGPPAAAGDVSWSRGAVGRLVETRHPEREAWAERFASELAPAAVMRANPRDGVVQVATMLAGAGADASAHAWSGLVDDAVLAGGPDGQPWLLGVLATVDLLAGDAGRARRRAAACAGRDAGWAHAAHRALALWVASRTSGDPAERERLLASTGYRHTWLGAIQQQIDLDRAALAEARGDHERAAEARDNAAYAGEHRAVELHVWHFPYAELLARLPVPEADR